MSRWNKGIEVSPGEIRLSSVDVLKRTNSIIILEIDTNSKYAGTWTCGWGFGGTDGPSFMFFATENVLRRDETTTEPTIIRLPSEMAEWWVYVDWSRYTIRIVAHKPPRGRFGRRKICRRTIWQEDRNIEQQGGGD